MASRSPRQERRGHGWLGGALIVRTVLEVARGRIHLTVTSGSRTRWQSSRDLAPDSTIADEVRELFAAAPRYRSLRRPRVTLLVSQDFSQVRRLEGLPALPHLDDLTQLVRENPFTFFLRASVSIVVADLRRDEMGAIWGAAFDADLIDQIARVVALGGRRVDRVTSSLATNLALVWFPRSRSSSNGRLTLACAALATVLLAMLAAVAPGAHARLILRRGGAERSRTEWVRRQAARSSDQIRRASLTLGAIERVDVNRGRATRFLAALANALPKTANVVSLRADSAAVTLVVTAPRIGEVLDRLSANGVVVDARLTGAIVRGTGADSSLARATIHARLAPALRR